jgi:hypothetical protein
VIRSILKMGLVGGLIVALSACSGGGTSSSGGGSGTGTWSVSTSNAAHVWPPSRIAARSHRGTGIPSLVAGGLLDLLLNVQPAYAAGGGVSGGSFLSAVGSGGSFSGSYSSTGPGGCTFTMTVSGSFSGTTATISMNGSGCNMTMTGSGNGAMDVAWPNSTSFSGSYTVTVSGGFSGSFSGTVSGKKS